MRRALLRRERFRQPESRWTKERVVKTLEWLLTAIVQGLAIPQILGTIPLFGTVACSGAFVLLDFRRSLQIVLRYWPLYFYFGMAMLSILWSDVPDKTFRTAAMMTFFSLAAIVSAARVELRQLVSASFTASLVVAIIGFGMGRMGGSTEGLVPIGLMGAKNGFSFSGQALLLLSIAVSFDRKQHSVFRMLGIFGMALGLLILVLTKSASGLVSAGIGVFAMAVMITVGSLPTTARIAAIFGLVICAIPITISMPTIQEEVTRFQEDVLKKDSTLTGRAYLWEKAEVAIAERPILGHGYQSFWTPGNIYAEELWIYSKQPIGAGFNFHNTFVEARIDLGLVGLCLLVFFAGLASVLCALSWIVAPSVGMAWMIAAMLATFAKFPVEAINIVIGQQMASWAVYGWRELRKRRDASAGPSQSTTSRGSRTFWRLPQKSSDVATSA